VTWSESENIRWKVPIEGRGSSTPIIWEDKIFLVTAIDTGQVDPDFRPPADLPENPFGITYPNTFHQYVVICLARESGRELWRRVAARRVPTEGHHGDNSFASASPTTDGQRLYVWFGSAGLFCYDLDGTLLWGRDLGTARTRLSFGEASSPVVHQDKVIVVRDQEAQSYIVVLDARSGETIWRADRDEPSGWSTPLVVNFGDTDQLVTNGKNRVRSYNLDDGSLIWECGGQASNVTPSPVATVDTVFCMSGYRGSALYALPLDANGDITDSDSIRWSMDRATPYVPSPLLYGDLLYFTQSNNAILSCVRASTGELLIDRERLSGIQKLYSSPVGAAGRIYIADRDGTTLVIRHDAEFDVIAENQLDEGTDASPAIVGNQLFIRGKSHLYCIAAGD
jgi:outer membrane protein assembly factor BamB